MSVLEQLAKLVSEKRIAAPDDEELAGACPHLWELLTADQYADGRARLLPIVMIERISGGFRVTYKDESLLISKRATALSWHGIALALEKALADPEVPWESYKSYRNKQGPQIADGETPRRKKKR